MSYFYPLDWAPIEFLAVEEGAWEDGDGVWLAPSVSLPFYPYVRAPAMIWRSTMTDIREGPHKWRPNATAPASV